MVGRGTASNSVEAVAARLKKTKKRWASGGTDEKVRALSTDVILERLAGFGVATSASEFVDQARAEHTV